MGTGRERASIRCIINRRGFLSVVQLSLQHGRELAPEHTRYMAGLLTTGYAIGQLVGPILSAISTALTHRLEPALYVAIVALIIAGALVIKTPARAREAVVEPDATLSS